MSIKKLKITNFRNFKSLSLDIPSEGICIIGSNGLGKTSVLEAIHYLLVGKSQRGSLKKNIINKDSDEFFIEGYFYNKSIVSIGYSKKNSKTVIRKDGFECNSVSDWFAENSVISFGPNDSDLIFGSPSDRRKFVDILLSISDSDYLKKLIEYKNYVSNRNRLLINSKDNELFDIYEQKIAQRGYYIFKKRKLFIESIANEFLNINKIVFKDDISIDINIKSTLNVDNVDNYEQMLITSLKDRREKEKILGFSTIGPHRDDLIVNFNDSNSKNICSRGQGRILSIALKIGTINWFNNLRDRKPIIMIDDAFAELDGEKTDIIYSMIKNKGQILLTSLSSNNLLDNSLEKFLL